MSFDRTNPDHCPTCDTTAPCVHRATRSAHVAYREGRDHFEIPWSNGTPIDKIDRTCMYAEGTDDSVWWHRGWHSVYARARVLEAERKLQRVGALLADERVINGAHVVEAKIDGRWWQYAGTLDQPRAPGRCAGAVADRTWDAACCPAGWSPWVIGALTPTELAAPARLVPLAEIEAPPSSRGDLR